MSNIVESLEQLTESLTHPESLGVELVFNKSKSEEQKQRQHEFESALHAACQSLFQTIEGIHRKHGHLLHKHRGRNSENKLSTLSQLDSLVMSSVGADFTLIDAETLWAQIDLQNVPLQKAVHKSTKQLMKTSENAIRLLMIQEDDDELKAEQGEEVGSDVDVETRSDECGEDCEDDDEQASDAEAKRMRDRMERAMAESDAEGESYLKSEPFTKANASNDEVASEEMLVDPAAEELNDGFFDLNEMESFADEEEEYLPDAAFDQGVHEPRVRVKDKRSFHQRQREGNVGSDDESDFEGDDDDNTLTFRKPRSGRRKKYRDDKEIDALYSLYKKPKDNDIEDDDDEVINMTAADLFGQPDKKFRRGFDKTWLKRSAVDAGNDEDDESWDDHQFNDATIGSGWGFAKGDGIDSQDESDIDEEALVMKESLVKDKAKGTGQLSKLMQQTEDLEAEMLAEKPWQMVGETGSMERPVNSLLDLTPEFDVASKLKPVVTVEQTADLEEIIKQRILKDDWDDVAPRELPDVGWHSKRNEPPQVSQEKSKLSLGELYEQEYLKKAVGYDVQAAEKRSVEDQAKDEMKSLFANLCSKLDALTNYHFAPRPIAEEAEVRAITTPAIAVEEVLPLYVSDARGAAPEEVYGAKRGRESILRSNSELEQGERKRLRGTKKSARRKARKEKLADEKLVTRLQPGLGLNNPYEKRKVREELSAARAKGRVTDGELDTNDYGASGTFFARLQEEAGQSVRGADVGGRGKRQGPSAASTNALKL
ncbi:hypothetical protein MPSEU_000893800 [Mayamaea pseudoterrestris]|nr:hypothetical protein MPSEU_000893800 [Mayamaea pseudoterrestris]